MRATSFLVCALSLLLPATALAWSPLRTENPSVKKGNAAMAEARYAEALEAYDTAARELPEAREVQLNRGLALLAQDLSEPAKEAFTAAADPAAATPTRAAAYYNLGIAYARQGEALSEEESLQEASSHFREAAQAFKQSLRQQPGNRDAAWNLEYALQRIREEEERNQEQDQQEQDQQEQDQQDQEPQETPVPRSEVERFLDALEQNEESLPLEQARRRNAGRRKPEKDW